MVSGPGLSLFGGSMREFLDAILAFIGAESLTDDEYGEIDLALPIYDQATYDALASVLEEREVVSTMQDRLVSYFTAKGVEVEQADVGKSHIYVGSVLE